MLNLENVIHPWMPGVFALAPQVLPAAEKLYSRQDKLLDTGELKDFFHAYQNFNLPILGAKDPAIIKDENGRDVLYQIWGHPKMPTDPRFMVILLSPRSVNAAGKPMFKPEKLIRGSHANVLLIGGMTCCGSAPQAHWSEVRQNEQTIISEGRVPLAGLMDDDHANWLEGRVTIASEAHELNAMIALAKEILSAKDPSALNLKISTVERDTYRAFVKQGPSI